MWAEGGNGELPWVSMQTTVSMSILAIIGALLSFVVRLSAHFSSKKPWRG